METKKFPVLKLISTIITVAITIVCILVYKNRITYEFMNTPKTAISVYILFAMFMVVMYSYIYLILKKISNKKFIIPILLILLLVSAVLLVVFIKDNVNYVLRNNILMLIFIIGVICLPLIIIGIILLGETKRKKIYFAIAFVLTITLYVLNYSKVFYYAEEVVKNFSSYSLDTIFSLRQEEKVDRTYLENYRQKYSRDGYLDRYDVQQILSIADSKSAITYINYNDEDSNLTVSITNKDDEKLKELEESLEANYYKFSYQSSGNETTINIERYIVEAPKNEEKNSDIILTGTKNADIIKNIDTNKSDNYFYLSNSINVDRTNNINNKISGFKVLFVYDEETEDYVPVVDDINEYSIIKYYTITNTYMEIEIKEGIELTNTDYTIRLNRYNNSLKLTNNSYHYEYEPVVTKYKTGVGTTLLRMDFDKYSSNGNYTYVIQTLKNIEIIFGK